MNSKDNATKKQKNKKRRNPFRYFFLDFLRITGVWSAALWLRPKRLYENKKAKKHIRGGAVAIANHVSFIDPIAMYFAFWYRHVHLTALDQLFSSKTGNWFFTHVMCIPVNRENFSIRSYRACTEVLKEGGVLGIFPEGAINREEFTLKSFKSGAAQMAIKNHVPIVPVYLVAPKKWYNRLVMVLGEPINPEELCTDDSNARDAEEISQKLREKELKLMEVYQQWKTRKSSKKSSKK